MLPRQWQSICLKIMIKTKMQLTVAQLPIDMAFSATGKNGIKVMGSPFYVEDVKMISGSYVYDTVQVTPIATGSMNYGSKFVHTYSKLNISGSATAAFTPSTSSAAAGGSLGLPHTMSFTVNVGTNINQWQLWADNAVNILEI